MDTNFKKKASVLCHRREWVIYLLNGRETLLFNAGVTQASREETDVDLSVQRMRFICVFGDQE